MARRAYAYSITLAQAGPVHDPDFQAAGPRVRADVLGWILAYGLKEKDADLAAGLDKDGVALAPVSALTRKHRRSAMGPADPDAPALMPAYAVSRTRLLLTGDVSRDRVIFTWEYDPHTAGPWGKILDYQRKGVGKRKVKRDVIGISHAALERVRGQVLARWTAWKLAGLAGPAPAKQAPAAVPVPRIRVVGRTDVEQFTYGIGGSGSESTRKALAAGYSTGFFSRKPGQGLTAFGGPYRRPEPPPGGGGPAPTPVTPPKPKPVPVPTPLPPARTSFAPAGTVAEAEAWLKARGVEPNWSTPNEPDYPYRITLDRINEVHAALDPLFDAYPEAVPAIGRLGSRYALDRNRWLANFERNVEEDRAEFEQAGKRWRRAQAETRVRRKMVSEPTPEGNDGGEYSIFEGGAWSRPHRPRWESIFDAAKAGETHVRFNHKTVVMMTPEKSEERRAYDMGRGRPLGNVGEDYFSAAQHEYGHAIDEVFEISRHPDFVSLRESLTAEEVAAGLSTYAATNLMEFLAEGFTEGLRPDARPLGTRVKSLIDRIVNERRGR